MGKERREKEKENPRNDAAPMPRSFTYSNEVRRALVLRASPRARAPSAPMMLDWRLR